MPTPIRAQQCLTAAPVTAVGSTNATGTADAVSRSDHLHRVEVGAEDDGVSVGSRPTLNFSGLGVIVTDDPGNDRINVAISGGGGGSGGAVLMWGAQATQTGTRYMIPGVSMSSMPLVLLEMRVPRAGTLRNLFVVFGSADTQNVALTVLLNGVATAITTTLLAGAVQGSDVVNTVAIAQGDRLALRQVRAGGGGTAMDPIVSLEFA